MPDAVAVDDEVVDVAHLGQTGVEQVALARPRHDVAAPCMRMPRAGKLVVSAATERQGHADAGVITIARADYPRQPSAPHIVPAPAGHLAAARPGVVDRSDQDVGDIRPNLIRTIGRERRQGTLRGTAGAEGRGEQGGANEERELHDPTRERADLCQAQMVGAMGARAFNH